MIPPSILHPPATGPTGPAPAVPQVVRRSTEPPADPSPERDRKKDPKKLAEDLLPLILRRVREEREALGDLTDPFA